MAAPVATLLANLPWGTIIKNAPAVVEQAQRLFAGVKDRGGDAGSADQPVAGDETEAIEALRDELQAEREELARLAQVVSELAELNEALVAKSLRMRLWLILTTGLAAIGVAGHIGALLIG